jgi:Carboxypeptidase regulatory-like domain
MSERNKVDSILTRGDHEGPFTGRFIGNLRKSVGARSSERKVAARGTRATQASPPHVHPTPAPTGKGLLGLIRKKNTRESHKGRPYHGRRARGVWFFVLMVVLVAGGSVWYAWSGTQDVGRQQVATVTQRPVFRPVVGDVNDPERNDPDITVERALVPGFQFRKGGFTLGGTVVDAHTGRGVVGAVVWIDLPVVVGQRSSAALHTVTDINGSYQFLHLAAGSYSVVASRYYTVGDGRYYAEHIFYPVMLKGDRSGLLLPLTPITAPGRRSIGVGQAKNVILIDLRGFYAASLLDDPLLLNQTQNLRAFLRQATVARSTWHPYGWRPLDQYALLTGSYPSWATYDPWPRLTPWGEPDNIDTTFWFTGGRSAHLFGQESIFDVAKGYGMQTGVVAGGDYILSDATTRNLDVLQRSSAFDATRWLAQVEDGALSGEQQSNGFLIYAELASLPTNGGSSSPDAQGGDYQQALLAADQTFGRLMNWLRVEGMAHDTLVVLTTSQAQANHSDADNFYGMGSTGQGSSKETFMALAGPGVCSSGMVDSGTYASFVIAPEVMRMISLPAPAESRIRGALPFKRGSC